MYLIVTSITLKGIKKLLEKFNISKAAGPELIPGSMLNTGCALNTRPRRVGLFVDDWKLLYWSPTGRQDIIVHISIMCTWTGACPGICKRGAHNLKAFFFFFFCFSIFQGGGPALKIAEKIIFSTKKVAKYR